MISMFVTKPRGTVWLCKASGPHSRNYVTYFYKQHYTINVVIFLQCCNKTKNRYGSHNKRRSKQNIASW